MITHRTLMMREDTQLNSTRKLLGEDMERSDKPNTYHNAIEERKDEDNYD